MVIFQAILKAHLEDTMDILFIFGKAQAIWDQYQGWEGLDFEGMDFLEWSLSASDEWL